MRSRSPSRCRPGATTSPGTVALEQAPTLDPAIAAKAAEGCAIIEPECDLVEEVLRLRGLDAVPPVSLPRTAPVPLATLTPRQTRVALARRTLAAQGLAECVTFSFMAAGEAALFGDTPDDVASQQPDRRRSGPASSDADRDAGARGETQRGARVS